MACPTRAITDSESQSCRIQAASRTDVWIRVGRVRGWLRADAAHRRAAQPEAATDAARRRAAQPEAATAGVIPSQ